VRRPLVLTGGPAVGKSTAGRLVAELRELCAFVDVDDLRQLVVSGHRAPWEGTAGQAQRMLGAANAALLARSFTAAGVECVVAGVVSPATASVYRSSLQDLVLLHLTISLPNARARSSTRRTYLTEAEFVQLHEADRQDPPAADLVLAVDRLSISEQVAAIDGLWGRASLDSTLPTS